MSWQTAKVWFFRLVEIGCYAACIAALYFSYRLFAWEREADIHLWQKGYIADPELYGNVGDFLSGAVGSLIAVVSMYLLFRTLRSQLAATAANSRQMEVQRFNDLFFNLLSVYREIASDKDFFSRWRHDAMAKITPSMTYQQCQEAMRASYGVFYKDNADTLGSYCRTIYRTLDLIEESNIPEQERKRYSKILRAQLTVSELFVLYYNAMTQGAKLRRYLWKYHLLKHLELQDTAAFQHRMADMNLAEVQELNRIYNDTFRAIRIVHEMARKSWLHNETLMFSSGVLVIILECSRQYKSKKQKNKQDIYSVNIQVYNFGGYMKEDYPVLAGWGTRDWKRFIDNSLSVMRQLGDYDSLRLNPKFIYERWPRRVRRRRTLSTTVHSKIRKSKPTTSMQKQHSDSTSHIG